MNRRLKALVTQIAARAGYTIRPLGPLSRIAGVDIVADMTAMFRGVSSPVLFDVGANVGQTTAEFLAAFRTPVVHVFEPSPITFQALHARFGHLANVTLNQVALGSSDGMISFHVNAAESVNDSALRSVLNARTSNFAVKATTVDNYCAERKIDSIDYLKIDAQGFDLHVLRGALGLLRARRIGAFSAEIMLDPMYEGQPTLVELLAFAADIGYKLVGFYDQNYLRDELNYLNGCFKRPVAAPVPPVSC